MRLLRRLLIMLIVMFAVLFVVGDRLAVSAANHAIAVKARNAAQLGETPSVTITGFPFLTQAAKGRYKDIKVTAHGIRRGGVRIDTIQAEFSGVHVSLSDALAGRVSTVEIDKGAGDIVITYQDLTDFLKTKSIIVAPVGEELSVAAQIPLAEKTVAASGKYLASLSGTKLMLIPVASSLLVDGAPVAAAALSAVNQALTIQIDTGILPFGLTLTSVHVTADGIRVDAAATGLVVPVPDDASRS
jgi:hypothetical protein